MVEKFHKCDNAKRRGEFLPERLRFAAHRGVTLVELMIAMLILTLVCVAWLEIIGIQSARREARRREAVERLVGMMDAFIYKNDKKSSQYSNGSYITKVDLDNKVFDIVKVTDSKKVHSIFGDDDKECADDIVSPVGYKLLVINNLGDELQEKELKDELKKNFGGQWKGKWLVGQLYNRSDCLESEAGYPFFVLRVCLGRKL